MLPVYEDIVAADAEIVDVSTRMYWSDSLEDVRRLSALFLPDRDTVRQLEANASTVVSGHIYQVAEL